MDRPSFRQGSFFTSPIVAATLAGAIGLSLFYNVALHKKNHTLLQKSLKLQESLQAAENENKGLAEKLNAFSGLKQENEKLQADLKKTADTLAGVSEEKTYLEEMLINKTKEIERLKKTAPSAPVGSGSSDDLANRLREKEEEIRRLNEHNRTLAQKLERLYKVTNDKIAEINVAKISLEETINQARKIIDSEWNTVELGSISVNNAAAPEKKAETRKSVKKEGRVLAVNEDHGFVVVDMGRVDGIRNDSTLSLKQNGQSIGTLTVLEVRDVMTACNIKNLSQGKKIQVNDLVLTQ